METSNLKNTIILKNLPSNLIEEAIVVLKTGSKIKSLEKIDKNEPNKNEKQKEKGKNYLAKEAEMIINQYIDRIEQKKKIEKENKNLKQKYKKIKKFTIGTSIIAVLEMILLIIV